MKQFCAAWWWLILLNASFCTVVSLSMWHTHPSTTHVLLDTLTQMVKAPLQTTNLMAMPHAMHLPNTSATTTTAAAWTSSDLKRMQQYVDTAVAERLKQMVPPSTSVAAPAAAAEAAPLTHTSLVNPAIYRQRSYSQTQLLPIHFIFTNREPAVTVTMLQFVAFYAGYHQFNQTTSSSNATEYEAQLNIWLMPGTQLVGPWYELVKQHCKVLERIITPQMQVEYIGGQRVWQLAHQADVLRLQILLEVGGVYLDSDMVMLQPLPETMWYGQHAADAPQTQRYNDVIMASEGMGGFGRLCNAFILAARPGADFLQTWLSHIRASFDDGCWSCDSVVLPGWLAQQPSLTDAITPLPYETFFKPNWQETWRIWDNRTDEWPHDLSQNYGLHLWNNRDAYPYGNKTLHNLQQTNNMVYRVIQQVLPVQLFQQIQSDPTLFNRE